MSNWENRVHIHLWNFISTYHHDRASYPNGDSVKTYRNRDWMWIIELDNNGRPWISISSVFDELHNIAYNQAQIKDIEAQLQMYKQDTQESYNLIKRIRNGKYKDDKHYYGSRDKLMVG